MYHLSSSVFELKSFYFVPDSKWSGQNAMEEEVDFQQINKQAVSHFCTFINGLF